MARKQYEMEFVLGAKQNAEYAKTFKSAESQIAAYQKEINALNKAQSDINAYTKQQSAIEATKSKLETYEKQLVNIRKEMDATEGENSELANKELEKSLQIENANKKLAEQEARLQKLGQSLDAAGIDTSDFAKAQNQLQTELAETKEAQEAAADSAQRSAEQISGAFETLIAAAGIGKALGALKDFALEASQASVEYESALAGVAKTTDFTKSELEAFSAELQQVSANNLPVAATELAALAEAGGQLGIAKEDLLGFTRVMADLGVATNLTSEEAATALAQFANITKMSAADFDRAGSTIVALGNNFATTESDIINMSMRLVGAGEQVGMSEAEIMGLSAALSSVGIEAEMGGSAISKVLTNMSAAGSTMGDLQTVMNKTGMTLREMEMLQSHDAKSWNAIAESLGMTKTELNQLLKNGTNLEDFAEIAGMTANEFKVAFEENAVGALQSFIGGLGNAESAGDSAIQMLQEMGITEVRLRDSLLRAAGAGDLLTNAVEMGNSAWKENTALAAEASKRYATTESQAQLAANAYTNLKVAIGDAYTPALRTAYKLEQEVFNALAKFAKDNPAVVQAMTATVGVFGLGVAAITAYTAVAKLAAVANKTLHGSLSPIALILGGVSLAVGALTLAYQHHEKEMLKARDAALDYVATARDEYREIEALKEKHKELADANRAESEEAKKLQGQIDALTVEYSEQMQTLEDYWTQLEATAKKYEETNAAHAEAYKAIDREKYSTLALIDKLEALSKTSESTAANQSAIMSVISALNETVPGLALSYDDVIKKAPNFVKSMREAAEADAKLKKQQEQFADYSQRVGNAENLEKDARESKEQLAIMNDDYAVAVAKAEELRLKYGRERTIFARDEYDAAKRNVKEMGEQIEAQTVIVEKATARYEENAEAINNTESAWQAESAAIAEANAATAEANAGITEVDTAMTNMKTRMESLAEAYALVYEEALKSVEGQFALWDKAEKIQATSAAEINKSLQSQIDYWNEYNSNLAALSERTDEIDGLQEVLASFADGTPGSIAAVKGMASATDDELASMVTSWQELQAEQKTVADSLADLRTDFSDAMANIQSDMETAVSDMNLSEEALNSGHATIQGFIDAATGQLPAVEAAYAKIAAAANRALEGIPTSAPFSTTYSPAGTSLGNTRLPFLIPGHAGGTLSGEDVYIAGERGPELIIGAQGSTVFPAQETERIIEAVSGKSTADTATEAEYAKLNILVNRELQGGVSNVTNNSNNLSHLATLPNPDIIPITALNERSERYIRSEYEKYNSSVLNTEYSRLVNERFSELTNSAQEYTAMPSRETERIIEAADGGRSGGGITISVAPVYNIRGSNADEVRSAIEPQNDTLRELIIDTLDEINYNNQRLAYA
jgi:TP901 family phage tail tape measure protein